MEGNNELRLCEAEMMASLQMYVDYLMPTAKAKVESVKEDSEGEFIIKLTKDD